MVRGTTILRIAVLRVATGTTPTTTISVFGLCAVFRRALFCARVGACECVERAFEESRPIPVMLVTVSENQPWLGSLVGVKPNSCPIDILTYLLHLGVR